MSKLRTSYGVTFLEMELLPKEMEAEEFASNPVSYLTSNMLINSFRSSPDLNLPNELVNYLNKSFLNISFFYSNGKILV